jgi:hypothetical protein
MWSVSCHGCKPFTLPGLPREHIQIANEGIRDVAPGNNDRPYLMKVNIVTMRDKVKNGETNK